MSQFWHSHWTEDAYKPVLLGNWEVPNWHPKWPCVRHCAKTTFLADRTGRLLPGQPRSKRSPWGDYKGTWQLPSRIDRKMAEKLSAPPKYKMAAWQAHKKRYEGPCGISPATPKRAKPKDVMKEQKLRGTTGVDTKTMEKTVTKSKRVATEKGKKAERSQPTAVQRKAIEKSKDGKTNAAGRALVNERKKTSKKPAKGENEKTEDKDKKTKAKDKKTTHKESPEDDVEQTSEEPVEVEGEKTIEESQEDNEEKYIPKEHPGEKVERETKKSRKIKCLCVHSPAPSKEAQKPKRDMCTIHQRLRV